MKSLTDEELVETYVKSKELELDSKFIRLLESELEKRLIERIKLSKMDNQF